MKKLILGVLGLVALVSTVSAQVRVNPYVKSDGTYVQGHYRSNADGNFYNNWSTKGNVNPYTGSSGTRVTPPSSYSYGNSYSTRSYGSSYSSPSYGSSSTYYRSRSRY